MYPSKSYSSDRKYIFQMIPFFYGWVVVAIAFITLGIGVNARTFFSLLFAPILEEFQWDRATIFATFSVGFVAATVLSPLVGSMMDKFGPRFVIPLGATITAAGFILATYAKLPWHFYMTLGLMVVGGSLFINYMGHTAFLPNWFSRRRGLAMGIAFSGVGCGSITLLPWAQHAIETEGWRQTSVTIAIVLLVVLVPLNAIFQRRRPMDLGLEPDGVTSVSKEVDSVDQPTEIEDPTVVDKEWVATEWTVKKAIKTSRYWWLMASYSTALYIWYAVQVHQTRYLIDVGISAETAALGLGLVGLSGVIGQIGVGYFSDRVGREWGWTVSLLGFLMTYVLLILISIWPNEWLMYVMACLQGLLGYGMASVFASVPAELFAGRRYGIIFGILGAFAGMGAAFGPWITGWLYDQTGNYNVSFCVAVVMCLVSIFTMWLAGPRKVRLVAGQVPRD